MNPPMPSNALSKRRGPLRRPKVCHTPKNPGRCEDPPVPGHDCYHEPMGSTGYPHEFFPINVHFCRGLPYGQQDVTIAYSDEFGSWGGPTTGEDCSPAPGSFEVGDTGVFWIRTVITWLVDGEQCTVNDTVTILEY